MSELGFRIGLRSLEREIHEPVSLELEGELPAGLRGTLYRIGPARWDIHGERLRHWFDGDGMVHAITLGEEGVGYRCRFVQHTAHIEEDRAGRRLYGSFGTSAPGGRIRRFLRRKQRRNPANTHVITHAGGLYALCEGGRPWRMDPGDLSTLGEETLGGVLPTPISTFTAHPRRDPVTGELWGFGVEPGRVTQLHLYRWPAAGAATKVVSVPMPMPAMIHDFGLTPTMAVIVATPVGIPDIPLGLILGQKSYGESLRYRPERGAHIGLIDRQSGATIWCETDPFVALHVVNAHDDGDEVVVDVCAYESDDIMHLFYEVMDGPLRAVRGALWRLRIDRHTRKVRREVLLGQSLDFPRVLDDRIGRPQRRIYGLTWDGTHAIPARPAVLELDTGRLVEAPIAGDAWAGELVPVARPSATGEGDAWLLTVVLDGRTGTSELQVLAADDVAAGPVARARLPHVMPLGFHGSWQPAV